MGIKAIETVGIKTLPSRCAAHKQASIKNKNITNKRLYGSDKLASMRCDAIGVQMDL